MTRKRSVAPALVALLLPGVALAGTREADGVAAAFFGADRRPAPPVLPAPAAPAAPAPAPARPEPEPEPPPPVVPVAVLGGEAPASFPGWEAPPAGVRVTRREVELRPRPEVGRMDARHVLHLEVADFARREFVVWLEPGVELRRVRTRFAVPEVRREGARVRLVFPYAPYRKEFPLEFLTVQEVPAGAAALLQAGTLWTPELGGPAPPTELAIRTRPGTAAVSTAPVTSREPWEDGTRTVMAHPGGTTPGVVVGPWTVRAGARVDLYLPAGSLPAAAETEIHRFLEEGLARLPQAFPVAEDLRVPAVVQIPELPVALEGPWITLDPEDPSWRSSWTELARRLVAAAWGVAPPDTGWVDEAVGRYVGEWLAEALGRESPAPPGPYRGAPLGPQPASRWPRQLARWKARSREGGARVLRALRAALGLDDFRAVLARLRASGPGGHGTEELRAALGRPGLDPFLRGVVGRGEALDFRVEEFRGAAAVERGTLGGNAYRTRVRLRLGRGARFEGPVPVLLETDLGRVRHMVDWDRPDEVLEVVTPSRVRRVVVDPDRWYPDPDPANNELAQDVRYPVPGVRGG